MIYHPIIARFYLLNEPSFHVVCSIGNGPIALVLRFAISILKLITFDSGLDLISVRITILYKHRIHLIIV